MEGFIYTSIFLIVIYYTYVGYMYAGLDTKYQNVLDKNKITPTVTFSIGRDKVVIDEKKTTIYIIKQLGRGYSPISCMFKNVISVELEINSNTIEKTARGSQLLGTVVGGVLLGGAGAVVGGLSGQKNILKNFKSADVIVGLNSIQMPFFKYNFTDKNLALDYYHTFKVIIERGKDKSNVT